MYSVCIMCVCLCVCLTRRQSLGCTLRFLHLCLFKAEVLLHGLELMGTDGRQLIHTIHHLKEKQKAFITLTSP